jgi:outer membrane protein TolC
MTTAATVTALGLWLAGPAHAQPPSDPATPPAATPATPPAGSTAPGANTVTLAQVLEVAVRQKPSLEQASIDIDIAEAAMLEALGLDDWIVDATASWVSTRQEAFELESDTFTLQGNLSRRLSTGGTVRLHAETSYSRGSLGPMPFTIYEHTVSGQLQQPLLRGRGKKIAHARRTRTRIARDAAALARQVEAIAAVREVVAAYWQLAFSWRDLEIRQSSMELTRERLRNTQAGIDAGAVAPTERLAVEQSIVAREEAILGAELTISGQSLTLRRLAGMELGRNAIDLHVSAPLTLPERSFDIDALLARALEASPTLARLRTLEEDARLEVELTENGLLPELDLVLSVGPTGSADNPGTALKNMVSFEDLEMSASLTYRRSLQRRQAKGAHLRARAQLRKQLVSTRDVEAQIAAQLVVAVKQAQAARKRFELGARAIELANKNIDAEKARFELGRATNFDVLQRQDELEQAQLRQARALIDYLSALADIDALTGDILGSYGITLEQVGAGAP